MQTVLMQVFCDAQTQQCDSEETLAGSSVSRVRSCFRVLPIRLFYPERRSEVIVWGGGPGESRPLV